MALEAGAPASGRPQPLIFRRMKPELRAAEARRAQGQRAAGRTWPGPCVALALGKVTAVPAACCGEGRGSPESPQPRALALRGKASAGLQVGREVGLRAGWGDWTHHKPPMRESQAQSPAASADQRGPAGRAEGQGSGTAVGPRAWEALALSQHLNISSRHKS